MTDFTAVDVNTTSNCFDSSILFRVTLHESSVLVGRPASSLNLSSPRNKNLSFAVIQVLSNALIMFQSIENSDATGTKTLHISVDNVSALVSTEFECIPPSQAPLILEPTGAEFRVVYSTENFGCIVSQDISFNCDSVKSCLTTNDASIVVNICLTMLDRLRGFGMPLGVNKTEGSRNVFSSLVRYQKKGSGVATRIRVDILTLSFVLLRAYKSIFGAPEFVDFNVKHVKGLFEGCISALSCDLSCIVSIVLFNSNVSDWEYAVEPCALNVGMEQMPNELVRNFLSKFKGCIFSQILLANTSSTSGYYYCT
jgi:hypothetical protein